MKSRSIRFPYLAFATLLVFAAACSSKSEKTSERKSVAIRDSSMAQPESTMRETTTSVLATPEATGSNSVGSASTLITRQTVQIGDTATTTKPGCSGNGVPDPTGSAAVGTTMIANDIRVYYPAETSTNTKSRPPYLRADEAAVLQLKPAGAGLRIPATLDASPLAGESRPVVLIGPGAGFPVAMLSGLGTELASQGFVAVMVDANYKGETTGEGYSPDDPAGPTRDRIKANLRALELLNDPSITRKIGPVDLTRIAAGGHSAGGSVAFNLALQDKRFRAVFDLDGNLYDDANTKSVTVPALGVFAGPSRDLTSNAEITLGPLGQVFSSNPNAVAVWIPTGAHFSLTDAPYIKDFLADVPGTIAQSTPCVARETATVVVRFLKSVLTSDANAGLEPTAEQLTEGLREIVAKP